MTPSEGKDSDSSDSTKTFIILCFGLSYRFFWISFGNWISFYSLLPSHPAVVLVNFIGTMKSNRTFELFFFHVFYCCYKPLPLHWAFAVLWSFPHFFFFFFLFNFLSLSLFFCIYSFVCLPYYSFPLVVNL